MNRLILYFLVFVCINIVCACDLFFFAGIVNESGNDKILAIKYDKKEIDQYFQKEEILKQISTSGRGGKLLSYDSVNFVSKIQLSKLDTFFIASGRGKLNLKFVERITVYGNDTTTLSRSDMYKLFKGNDRLYILKLN